jgi:sugar lactone lactonase YvrE
MEVGAANFSSGGCTTGNALCEPSGVAIDSSRNVWVGDGQNASVQEFKAPFSLGESSSVLLGGYYLDHPPNATNFGPNGLAFDSSGNLWIVDGGFNRVLEFTPPFTSRMAASVVIGQSNFTSVSNNNNQSMLNSPSYITFDHSGNLWVSDTYDNRVLEFKAPFSNGESASIALGQPNLSSTSANTTQSTLNMPAGIAFDSHGNLWVSDESNNRIVEFVPPFSTGMSATVVIGQTSYFFSGPGAGNSSVNDPEGLAAGPNGNLWVDDSGNYRVLLFVDPASAATASTTTSTTLTPTVPVTTTTSSQAQTTATTSSQAVSSSQAQTTSSSSSSVASATSSPTSSAALPEFPYQVAAVSIFTLMLAGAYLFLRRRSGRD